MLKGLEKLLRYPLYQLDMYQKLKPNIKTMLISDLLTICHSYSSSSYIKCIHFHAIFHCFRIRYQTGKYSSLLESGISYSCLFLCCRRYLFMFKVNDLNYDLLACLTITTMLDSILTIPKALQWSTENFLLEKLV